MKKTVLLSLIAILVAIGAIVGSRRWRSPSDSAPVAFVEEPSLHVVAEKDGAITATYQITNRGGRDLILGRTSTSCGCSVASIPVRTIKPSETGSIVVEGRPPDAGERTVEIKVETNAEPRILQLELTMVGHRKPPFVVYSSGPVRFGVVHAGVSPETIAFGTREPIGPPWIVRPEVSPDAMTIRGGLVKEEADTPGFVFRNYQYTVSFAEIPGPGEINGEASFFADLPGAAVLRLPIQGVVRPAVFAAPSTIFANWGLREASPRLTLAIKSDDPEFPLRVDPSAECLERFEIREVESRAGVVVFELTPRPVHRVDDRVGIVFRTNHPLSPSIAVPVSLRRSDG